VARDCPPIVDLRCSLSASRLPTLFILFRPIFISVSLNTEDQSRVIEHGEIYAKRVSARCLSLSLSLPLSLSHAAREFPADGRSRFLRLPELSPTAERQRRGRGEGVDKCHGVITDTPLGLAFRPPAMRFTALFPPPYGGCLRGGWRALRSPSLSRSPARGRV